MRLHNGYLSGKPSGEQKWFQARKRSMMLRTTEDHKENPSEMEESLLFLFLLIIR